MAYEKGRRTREHIVRETGAMLNMNGYAGTTVDDILQATGLTKGGLYRHFPDKETVALEGYRFNLEVVADLRASAVAHIGSPLERLRGLVQFGQDVISKLPLTGLKGGCPILNLAIEADDTRPKHRQEARRAMDRWRSELISAGRAAREAGELARDFDPERFASLVISATEGGIAQSHLYRDASHVESVVSTLLDMLEAFALGDARATKGV
jgi:TetR/AcrR family transcriptional regulator, transcriptional repressor for nem operon